MADETVTRTARIRTPADFGMTLQHARLARGLSQTEVADSLEVSQSEISDIESGKSTIAIRRLLALAKLVDLEFVATWEDTDAPRS